jgi:hypothetical protein
MRTLFGDPTTKLKRWTVAFGPSVSQCCGPLLAAGAASSSAKLFSNVAYDFFVTPFPLQRHESVTFSRISV